MPDFEIMADLFIDILWEEFNVNLIYDEATVKWLENYIEQVRPQYRDTSGITENIGTLLGQIIIKNYGGEWRQNQEGWWGVYFNDNNAVFPFTKVAKQFANGLEDSIFYFYKTLPPLLSSNN